MTIQHISNPAQTLALRHLKGRYEALHKAAEAMADRAQEAEAQVRQLQDELAELRALDKNTEILMSPVNKPRAVDAEVPAGEGATLKAKGQA